MYMCDFFLHYKCPQCLVVNTEKLVKPTYTFV